RGELIKIHFKDGTLVKKGDPLFDLDPQTYKASLAAALAKKDIAESQLKLADSEVERNRALLARDATSARDVEAWLAKKGIATGEVEAAKAEIDRANLDVGFCQIKAPISGKISRPQVTTGNLINAGGGDTLLTTIVSVDPIYVYFDVDE